MIAYSFNQSIGRYLFVPSSRIIEIIINLFLGYPTDTYVNYYYNA